MKNTNSVCKELKTIKYFFLLPTPSESPVEKDVCKHYSSFKYVFIQPYHIYQDVTQGQLFSRVLLLGFKTFFSVLAYRLDINRE